MGWIIIFGVVVVLLWILLVTRAFVADALFGLARAPRTGAIVGWGFEHLTLLLPLERVLITDKTIAFKHPRPTWSTHVLIVPRKQIRNIFELTQTENQIYLEDIWRTARDVFVKERFSAEQYALLVNGGIRQDVKQVHFHLHQPKDVLSAPLHLPINSTIMQTKAFSVHQRSEQPLHLLLIPKETFPPLSKWEEADVQQLSHLELPLDELEQVYTLSSRGFSLIIQEDSELEQQQLVIHLTAGKLQ